MKYREMKRQPRAKAMLPAIKELITIRSLENRDKDRTLLSYELIEEIQDKFTREIPPTHATLIKKISEARSRHETSPLDKPWSLAVLNRLHELEIFDVNADAIEYIQKVQYYVDNDFREDWSRRLKENMKKGHPEIEQSLITDELIAKAQGEYPVLTIRQAKWVARLYRLQSDNIHRLYFTAVLYSNYEIVSEISCTPFNTAILDQAIHNWSDFSELIYKYSISTRFDDILSKASARSFNPEQNNEGEK